MPPAMELGKRFKICEGRFSSKLTKVLTEMTVLKDLFVRKMVLTKLFSPIFQRKKANRNVASPPKNIILFPMVQVDRSTLAERRTITTTVIPYMVCK